ncbi:MAG: OmpA family protein [Lachnospiraceae bacterium]|nr:OmpA family protein [Lachnospiraceae bacterium]
MAKKKPEEPPKGSPAWMSTFSDLMNLLLCFFVLLFAMSNVDESKFNAISESMALSFSLFSKGSKAYGDGTLVSNGASQLNQLDEYYQSMGETNTSKEDEEIYEDGNQNGKDDMTGSEDKPNPSEGSTNNTVGDNNEEKGDDGDKTAPNDSQQTPGETDDNSDNNNQSSGNQNQDNQGGKEEQNNQGDSSSDKDNNANVDDDGDKAIADENDKGKDDKNLSNWQEQMYAANKEQTMNMYSEVAGLLDKYQLADSISLSVDTSQYQYILLEVKGAVLFESGNDKIKNGAEAIIRKIGDILKIYGSYNVEVIGHTDSVPINTTRFPNNNYLSTARAISVAQFLIDDCAISSDRITFSGRGEYEPIAPNNTKEGRERNRRVEFKLYNALNSK